MEILPLPMENKRPVEECQGNGIKGKNMLRTFSGRSGEKHIVLYVQDEVIRFWAVKREMGKGGKGN